MKATGITRRIDDLGRIVIPSIIRKELGLQEGTALEFFIEEENLVLSPYDKISKLVNITKHLTKALKETKDYIDEIDYEEAIRLVKNLTAILKRRR